MTTRPGKLAGAVVAIAMIVAGCCGLADAQTIYNQLNFKDNVFPHSYRSVGDNTSFNVTEWTIQKGPIYPVVPHVAQETARGLRHYEIIVLDIETSRAVLRAHFPDATDDEIVKMDDQLRRQYYRIFKRECPRSLIIQYNMPDPPCGSSDAIWLSMYYNPEKEKPGEFLQRYRDRLESANHKGRPVFCNTSFVVFKRDSDGTPMYYAMDPAYWDEILTEMTTWPVDGISVWSSTNPNNETTLAYDAPNVPENVAITHEHMVRLRYPLSE